MATFIATITFTEQGITKVRDTCKRADAVKAAAKKMGCKVAEIYWTLGPKDGLIIFDAPDEETATALMLHVAALGNVHTQTARAYNSGEMEKIVKKMGKG
jgi:uncharacterized protein with GYD domain